MNVFLSKFTQSAKEFKNLRSVTGLAMLMAISLVLSLTVSIQITQSLRLSFSFLAIAAMGMLYGPVCASVAAGLGDIFQYVLKPTGEFFPGFTLTAALVGLLYGLFLYRNHYSLPRLIGVQLAINLLLHLVLNSYWLTLLYGYGFWAELPGRLVKNVVLLPVEVLLLVLILPIIVKAAGYKKHHKL